MSVFPAESMRPGGPPVRARTRERGPRGPEQSFLGGHGGRDRVSAAFCKEEVLPMSSNCKEEVLPMSSNITPLQTLLPPQTIEKHRQDGQGLESSRYQVEFPFYGSKLQGCRELNVMPGAVGTGRSPPLS